MSYEAKALPVAALLSKTTMFQLKQPYAFSLQ